MKIPSAELRPVLATLLLAALGWFITFYLSWGVFWFKILISALALAGLSVIFSQKGEISFSLNVKSLVLGVLSAVLLYLIFWLGKSVSSFIFPFAGEQIGAIYQKGQGTSIWLIAMLLFFVTGPCEEIYWRGYLQKRLMQRFGNVLGWLLATLAYALVHIWSFNFMLVGAAAVAGAFWGLMYWRFKDLSAVIISHAIWSTFIFAVQPIP